jgi:hypothetical protein
MALARSPEVFAPRCRLDTTPLVVGCFVQLHDMITNPLTVVLNEALESSPVFDAGPDVLVIAHDNTTPGVLN